MFSERQNDDARPLLRVGRARIECEASRARVLAQDEAQRRADGGVGERESRASVASVTSQTPPTSASATMSAASRLARRSARISSASSSPRRAASPASKVSSDSRGGAASRRASRIPPRLPLSWVGWHITSGGGWQPGFCYMNTPNNQKSAVSAGTSRPHWRRRASKYHQHGAHWAANVKASASCCALASVPPGHCCKPSKPV